MSEEEKKAIEDLKKLQIGIGILNDFIDEKDKDETDIKAIDIVLNLIEKQQKQIQDLKANYKKLDRENQALYESINIEDDNMLIRLYQEQKEENKELENKRKTTMEVIGANYIHKDKIREKIEELKNDEKNIREKKKNSHDYDRSNSRLQAYLTKTKEMIKRLEELLEE